VAYDAFSREKGLGYVVAFLYSLVVALVWVPAFVLRRTVRFLREVGVENWRRANGSITSGTVKVIHGWVVDYAVGELAYSYRVAGEYYAGSITRQYPDEQAAWDFVDARRDKPVVVRYRDDRAQVSALRDVDQEPGWTGTEPGLVAMVWQHWRDGLRGEEQPNLDDESIFVDDEEVNHADQVGR
jgi:hypothetical protein